MRYASERLHFKCRKQNFKIATITAFTLYLFDGRSVLSHPCGHNSFAGGWVAL